MFGIIASTVLLVLNACTKNHDLGELAQKHKQAANDLWLIREKHLSLLTDLAMQNTDIAALQQRRDVLLDELRAVHFGAPGTTFQAHRRAQNAFQKLEDPTFSDEEIDAFLPKPFKRGP
jgi:hypothetical protein